MKVIKCDRCRKRCRNADGWNAEFVAGLVVGHLCPSCQEPQEDIEAEVNLILDPPSRWRTVYVDSTDASLIRTIEGLVATYPTPEVMRRKAARLSDARKDPAAKHMAELMRRVADDMESGELWEDA